MKLPSLADTLSVLASSGVVHAGAQTLLHFLWQGGLIAAVLWLSLWALPRAHSTARYAACCVALAAMLVAPLSTFALELRSAGAPVVFVPASSIAPASASYMHLALLVVWVLGGAAMAARLVAGMVGVRRLVAQAAAVEGQWQQKLGELARRVGLSRQVRLLASSGVDAPMTLGLLRPVVILPFSALSALPSVYLEALFIHELAHIRRLDYLVNIVQVCVESALYYHPAVHWVSARMREEREHCCDDFTVCITGDHLGYARALADMEGLRLASPALGLGSNGGSLVARVERIVARGAAPATSRPSLAAFGVLAAVVCSSLIGIWSCGNASGAADETSLDLAWLPPGVERWAPALNEAAQRHGVDPALLAIVTLVESMGDPNVKSPSGAVGLMQLMPATAADIARVRQLSGYTEARLLEPAYNVDLGAWYLAEQMAAFGAQALDDKSVGMAAMAYNAGPKLARAFLEGKAPMSEEARNYRDLVVGMWNDRDRPESPTFSAWRAQLTGR